MLPGGDGHSLRPGRFLASRSKSPPKPAGIPIATPVMSAPSWAWQWAWKGSPTQWREPMNDVLVLASNHRRAQPDGYPGLRRLIRPSWPAGSPGCPLNRPKRATTSITPAPPRAFWAAASGRSWWISATSLRRSARAGRCAFRCETGKERQPAPLRENLLCPWRPFRQFLRRQLLAKDLPRANPARQPLPAGRQPRPACSARFTQRARAVKLFQAPASRCSLDSGTT